MRCNRVERVMAWLSHDYDGPPEDRPALHMGRKTIPGEPDRVVWREHNVYFDADDDYFLWENEVDTLLKRGRLQLLGAPGDRCLVVAPTSWHAVRVT